MVHTTKNAPIYPSLNLRCETYTFKRALQSMHRHRSHIGSIHFRLHFKFAMPCQSPGRRFMFNCTHFGVELASLGVCVYAVRQTPTKH